MRLTEQGETNLLRFGCTLQPNQNLLVVNWAGLTEGQALAATILVRSIHTKCVAGPLLCLALEISPTLALAHYCYFPFNLGDSSHRKYLTLLGQMGQLRLAFLAGRKTILRDHILTPAQCKRINQLCAEASDVLHGCAKYKFSDVVKEFERTIRVSQFFERTISDKELAESLESLTVRAGQVSPEKRRLASQMVHSIANVLAARYETDLRKFVAGVQGARKPFLTLFDFLREVGSDGDRLVDVLSDYVAVNAGEEFLRTSSDWPSKLDSILNSLHRASVTQDEKEKLNADFTTALGRTLAYLGSGRGLSLSMLQNLLQPFRPLLTGQPGRPTRDYSREYGWKASGMSWTEVAARHFQENAEVGEEFAGKNFDSLAFEDKETLKGRIREGVRSYAERAGKQFPLPEPVIIKQETN